MRFRDLDQQAVAGFWGRWKHIVQEILEEFNEDVYHGRGIIRENSYKERIYLALETRKECWYVFPLPGNLLILSLYRCKIAQDCLRPDHSGNNAEQDNRIGRLGLRAGIAEERGKTYKQKRGCVEELLRRLYEKHQVNVMF